MNTIFRYCIGVWGILCASSIATAAAAASPWEELEAFETHRAVQTSYAPFKPAPKETRWGGWYAGLHTAAVILPNTDFVGSGLDMEVDFDTGFALGGSLGYAYDFGLRLESEVTYRVVQAQQLDISGFKFSGSGNIDTINLMLNSWFDIKFLSFLLGDWVPYFGAGAGLSHAWSNVGSDGVPIVEAEDTRLAWQGGGGFAYKMAERLYFTLDYRYFRTFGSFVFDDPFYAGPIKAKHRTHNVTVGFRGNF